MRDTLVAVLFIAGLAGGYFFMRDTASLSPKLSAQAASQKFTQQRKTGVRHDQSANRDESQQSQNYRQDEGDAGQIAEAQSLPSIYQEQSAGQSAQPTVKSKKIAASRRPPRKGKVLHGVPVEAWVLSRQNTFSVPTEEGPSELGMRVFVQCMELKKKGAEYVGQNECQSLLAHR